MQDLNPLLTQLIQTGLTYKEAFDSVDAIYNWIHKNYPLMSLQIQDWIELNQSAVNGYNINE